MFDDDHRVAGVDESVQHPQQVFDVDKVQTGRRFVEDVDRLAGGPFAQLARKLHALGFTAGQRGRRLAELDVIQSDIMQRLQRPPDLRMVFEMDERLLHVHVEHVGDALSLEANLQRLLVEAVSLADGAGDPDVGEEIHLQLVRAVPFARLAATARHVEREAAGLEAAQFGLGQLRVQVAHQIEQLDVRGRIRAGRPADRALVDVDRLVDVFEPDEAGVRAGLAGPLVDVAVEDFPQDVVHQRTLAAAADTGHADELSQGKAGADTLQIVMRGPVDFDRQATASTAL